MADRNVHFPCSLGFYPGLSIALVSRWGCALLVAAMTVTGFLPSGWISPTLAFAADDAAAGTGKQPAVDPALPSYQPAKGITGRLKSVGSDTMNNLLALWSEGFRKLYPSVRIEIEGKGSGTAPPALIQGTTDFGPMSRDMNPDEIAQFTSTFGYPPAQLPVAIDMLAVFVHQDNPLESLTLEQLDALYSVGRKKGGKEIRTWGDLGLGDDWANKPVSLYGRNPASGTYVYFKEHVLEKGDFKPTVKQLGGSSAVIQGVATDRYGIGYSGIGYKTADVKALSLARNKKTPPVPAESQFGYDGTYPLSRFLLLSINYKPKSELTPSTAEFIRFVYSREGQTDVIKEGFLPVTAKIAERGIKSVGLSPAK
ncbi:MAG TPA: phosphate ABC transporter substrate-binding protein [Pirellulales bacterium]|nr:phosphate ABC transporter substrate-binding protein [Pirellulales bacterium]